MTTIVRGPRPPELEQLLERRRLSGADRYDEVWEGRYVVAPDPHPGTARCRASSTRCSSRWPAGSASWRP